MRFKIIATCQWDGATVLERHPRLKKYDIVYVIEDGVKFISVKLDTLEQIIELAKELDEEIIIMPDFLYGEVALEIYDDYRE